MNKQKVIDDIFPMISELLMDLGMVRGQNICFLAALKPFSTWISSQHITPDDFTFLVSRIAAFICCYYLQMCNAHIVSEGNMIRLQLPLGSITHSIDPYFFASLVVNKQLTLEEVIAANLFDKEG